jgi:hypothetical protein
VRHDPREAAARYVPRLAPCQLCGRPLWPDITIQDRPPVWVCVTCTTPRARFWHVHDGGRCPLGHHRPLLTDSGGRRHICR